MVDIAQQMEERSFHTPMMQVFAFLTIASWHVALGAKTEEESHGYCDDIAYNHEDYHHKWEPSKLTGMIAVTCVPLGCDSKRFDGIQIVEVGIFKHDVLISKRCRSPIELRVRYTASLPK